MKAVILAGGRGTRLGPLTKECPKPLLEVGGRPLLAYQFDLLAEAGVSQVFVTTGYLAEQIEQFCHCYASPMKISCVREKTPLGTAGGVALLAQQLEEDFLLLYGDVFLGVDLLAFYTFHQQQQAFATLYAHPNDHPWDSDLLEVDEGQQVRAIHKKPHTAQPANMSNAALYVLSPRLFRYIPSGSSDFMHDVLPAALAAGERLVAYNKGEFLKDMGTPERLAAVEQAWQAGKVERVMAGQPRAAVFLDRDGTLVEHVDQLHRQEDLHLLPGAGAAVQRLNRAGLLAIVVTNQSVVARNLCSLPQLQQIHARLGWLLAEEGGGYLDHIYFCPHHPDGGYPEENAAYKGPCDCRKPGTAMLEAAREQFNLDISSSWLVGDSEVDMETGKRMGMRTALVLTGQGQEAKGRVEADLVAADLDRAVDVILHSMGVAP